MRSARLLLASSRDKQQRDLFKLLAGEKGPWLVDGSKAKPGRTPVTGGAQLG